MMFTGIVEQVAEVRTVGETAAGRRLALALPSVPDELEIGDSVSVAGVCLTVVGVNGGGMEVDVIPESLDRTTLGFLGPGDRVNVELAMPAAGRFDGHLVQGHVDGVGTVRDLIRGDNGVSMTIEARRDLMRYIVEKGSITVDGVSLTVAGLGESTFDVALIPHTLAVTTLGLLEAGARVNLEVDVLAKYVERLMEARQ